MLVVLTGTMLTLGSCAKDDDYLEVDLKDPTEFFVPADDDTTQTAQLRRDFKAEQGSYLLFNDTLQNNYLGKDANGEDVYFVELLDVDYSTMSSQATSRPYTYTYLKTYDRQLQAVEFVKEYIISHFSSNLRPFSYLLVNKISGKDAQGNKIAPYAVSGERCIVLAMSELRNLTTAASKKKLAIKHLVIIVAKLASNNSSYFTEFKAVSNNYYGTSFNLSDGETKTEKGMRLGFVSVPNIYFPTYDTDISSYASLVLTYDDAQIEKRYANYPLIVKKAKLYREALTKMGYLF